MSVIPKQLLQSINPLSIQLISQGHGGTCSQKTLREGGVHSEQVTNLMQGQHREKSSIPPWTVGNPHRHEENMQIQHRLQLASRLKQKLLAVTQLCQQLNHCLTA